MARIELLNNIAHKDLCINPLYSVELGDNVASTVTFVTEFAEVQKEYPILFRREPVSGEFQAVVLLGIQKDENLFLTEESKREPGRTGWNAAYIPAAVVRGPFTIGFQRQEDDTEARVPVIHVDMDHPKVSTENGERVFLEQGGNSNYLNHIIEVMNLIRDGMQLSKPMFDAFEQYELIEDVSIDIELDNQEKFKISGFQTINADKLSALDGAALEQLSRPGFLQAAYFVVASLSNIKRLISAKNVQIMS